MNKKKLKKLRTRLGDLRARPRSIKSSELIRLARSLGRKRFNRGKEPTFINELLPKSRPLSIPNHPGTLKIGTAMNILDELEKDIDDHEALLG